MTIIAADTFWILESDAAAIAFGLADGGYLYQSWWGRKLPDPADYPRNRPSARASFESPLQQLRLAIPTGEAGDSDERMLDATSADGHLRGLVLRFAGAVVDDNTLHFTMDDAAMGLTVRLSHTTLDAFGLFARAVTVTNTGSTLRKLTRVFTGAFHLPTTSGGYALSHLAGLWGDEFRTERDLIPTGTLARESRKLTTSHGGVPWFAIDHATPGLRATEETGEVWFGTLNWSGNWRLIAEHSRDGRQIVHLGLNDADFGWDLHAGEVFEAPAVIFGYCPAGFGPMSRAYHDYIRDAVSPRPGYMPKVVYNSWYATTFAVDAPGQIALANKAAAMGVELFVMDDGWFQGRNHDAAGLGDWWPDPVKFPEGLGPLVAEVQALGMQFGLWIEPEMVNPDSDLYRVHPDWILHYPQRDRTLARNQSILNLARVDVQDYLIGVFDTLLRETPIDFVKWDMNRNVSEPGWPGHDRDPREVWVHYVRGVYRVWSELRRRHPDVVWENCSGGGGRVDLAMMALAEQTWTSDTTVPPARLQIQDGYSRIFPARTMAGWITDEEHGAYSLDLRCHAAMAGAFGIGGNLLAWSDADQALVAAHIARFKALRPCIMNGDLYRLCPPGDGPVSAFAQVAKDKSMAVVFVFRLHKSRIGADPAIRLAGLDPTRLYRCDETGQVMSGTGWAAVGMTVALADFQSAILVLRAVGHLPATN